MHVLLHLKKGTWKRLREIAQYDRCTVKQHIKVLIKESIRAYEDMVEEEVRRKCVQ